jgi:hypothetical protein
VNWGESNVEYWLSAFDFGPGIIGPPEGSILEPRINRTISGLGWRLSAKPFATSPEQYGYQTQIPAVQYSNSGGANENACSHRRRRRELYTRG